MFRDTLTYSQSRLGSPRRPYASLSMMCSFLTYSTAFPFSTSQYLTTETSCCSYALCSLNFFD